jgi:hypothetical protein
MQVVLNGYLGLSVLAGLNRDRVFVLGPIIVGLLAGAFPGFAIVQHGWPDPPQSSPEDRPCKPPPPRVGGF